MQKVKKIIPNLLTMLRIIVTPIALVLGMNGYYKLLAVICIFVALTDFLDGTLARKWDVCSELGAKLDTIGDKTLAFSLLIVLVIKNSNYIYPFILEAVIALMNLFIYMKSKVAHSEYMGKVKTWVLFITLISGTLAFVYPQIKIFVTIGIPLTIIFQLLTIIFYVRYYLSLQQKKK